MNLGSGNKVDPSFNMSSMTDLVFLLLIFFIILSTMIAPPAVKVNLPNGNPPQGKNTPKVSLTIDKELNHYINKQKVDPEALEQYLATFIPTAMEGTEKPTIVLHVDKSVPTGITTNVLVIARKNEWNIGIATDGK